MTYSTGDRPPQGNRVGADLTPCRAIVRGLGWEAASRAGFAQKSRLLTPRRKRRPTWYAAMDGHSRLRELLSAKTRRTEPLPPCPSPEAPPSSRTSGDRRFRRFLRRSSSSKGRYCSAQTVKANEQNDNTNAFKAVLGNPNHRAATGIPRGGRVVRRRSFLGRRLLRRRLLRWLVWRPGGGPW